MLVAGPVSGYLSDRFGARPFATGGMLGSAVSLRLLLAPADELRLPRVRARSAPDRASRWALFASPNRAAVMNSLPAAHRGAGGGMNQTFQNSAQVLSIGIFFTLMIVGLSVDAAAHARSGLEAHGVAAAAAAAVAHLPTGLGPLRRVPRLQPGRSISSARTCSPASARITGRC